jgi:hypothetical protein
MSSEKHVKNEIRMTKKFVFMHFDLLTLTDGNNKNGTDTAISFGDAQPVSLYKAIIDNSSSLC